MRKNKGESKRPIYISWNNMMSRCNRKSDRYYEKYGGRGIEVCDEWKDFAKFSKWAYKNGYLEGLTLERIEFNKGYCPDNCLWTPKEMQSLNRENSVRITVNLYMVEVCRLFNIPYSTLYSIYKKGGDIDELITKKRYENGRKNFYSGR